MSNLFIDLNKWIDLLLLWEVQDASDILKEIYLKSRDYKNDNNDFNDNYIILLSALWEIEMKSWNFESSLTYYSEANELSDWKNFNILFNIWISYNNLWKKEEWNHFIKKAQEIEGDNEYLLKYLDNN